ncbi:MAG: zinc-binding dehydrogenase [Planctomycetota bacterium]
MRALVFYKSVPRFVLLKALGARSRWLNASRLAPLGLRDIAPPPLPTERWVRIRPKLAGVCGSDLATLSAKGSTYLSPLISLPFVMGHEVVGVVSEIGRGVTQARVGDRVVVHPALGCTARGVTPRCDSCRDERDALCRNVTRGDVSAGIQIGYCRDTGGGFGESLVAHETQVHVAPPEIEDRAAVLIEPFACALHGALRASVPTEGTALVLGCGAIGLLTIAALRATGCKARIVAAAKYDHQGRAALALGADEWLPSSGRLAARYARWAEALSAQTFRPELGKPAVVGGADVTFDCVASSDSIDDGIRFTKSGGAFVLVGMPGVPRGVDWTPLWFKELTLHAAYAYGWENTGEGRRSTFDLAIDLMRTWGPRLSPLVGRPFALEDYRAAIATALHSGRSGVVKTVFSIDGASA